MRPAAASWKACGRGGERVNKFLFGSAMGVMLGAGLMMMPGARTVQHDAMREFRKLKKQMKHR